MVLAFFSVVQHCLCILLIESKCFSHQNPSLIQIMNLFLCVNDFSLHFSELIAKRKHSLQSQRKATCFLPLLILLHFYVWDLVFLQCVFSILCTLDALTFRIKCLFLLAFLMIAHTHMDAHWSSGAYPSLLQSSTHTRSHLGIILSHRYTCMFLEDEEEPWGK